MKATKEVLMILYVVNAASSGSMVSFMAVWIFNLLKRRSTSGSGRYSLAEESQRREKRNER